MRRYAALSGEKAQRFLAGRSLMAGLIDEFTDAVDLGFTTTCERCGAEHGRPRLERAPVAVSISYAGSVVAVAAAALADAAGVGVDIEREPVGGEAGASASSQRFSHRRPRPTPRGGPSSRRR